MFFRSRKLKQAENDWATQAADHIERVIDTIRDKAVVPLTTIARGIVYGTLAIILAVSATVLSAILLIRILDIYLHNFDWMPNGVWIVDLIVGGIFVAGGLLAWSFRKPRTKNAS